MLAKLKQYWQPHSLTFWGGAVLIVSGVLESAGNSIPGISEWVRPLIDAYVGGGGATVKIGMGMGLIGIRRKLDDVE